MYRNIEEKELRIDASLGYTYFLDKNHPLATGNSHRVYYHRHVMSMELGRWVNSDEVVHHIDENKLNNNLSNLQVLSNKEHVSLHTKKLVDITCKTCKVIFKPQDSTQKYCTPKCAQLGSRKIDYSSIDKEELETNIWMLGFTKAGLLYGYSDSGLKKLAKKLGCNMPPPYFHQKVKPENRLQQYIEHTAQQRETSCY
jgi:hypothetical protein